MKLGQSAIAVASAIVLVVLALLFALDAAMLLQLRRSAKAAEGRFEADAFAKLLFLKRVSVATSTVAIVIYLVRVLLEFGIAPGGHFSLDGLKVALIFLVLIGGSKGLRLLAVNSFGSWLRLHSGGSQKPTEG